MNGFVTNGMNAKSMPTSSSTKHKSTHALRGNGWTSAIPFKTRIFIRF